MKVSVLTQKVLLAVMLIVMGGKAQAELTYHTTGHAQITWGDNLEAARKVMYENTYHVDLDHIYQQQHPQTQQYTNQILPVLTQPTDYWVDWQALESKGVLVLDEMTGQVLFERNAHIPRPIASLSKLMTAIVLLESGVDMSEIINIQSFDFISRKKSGADVLKVGDELNRAELLLMTLVKSENPAAKALARTSPMGYEGFIAAMNQKAMQLGMTQTRFYDASGLDPRNVSSPNDLAILARYVANHPLISKYSVTPNHTFWVNNSNLGSRDVFAKSTNRMVRDGLFNIVLSKTGYIREAGRCLIVRTNMNNRPAIMVLLGAEDPAMRERDAMNILTALNRRF